MVGTMCVETRWGSRVYFPEKTFMSHPTVALRRLRALAGLAAAVIPASILVHLAAEMLSLGRAALGFDFVVRHVYLGALLVGGLWAFSRTVGLGRGRTEVRRRTALLRAGLTGPRRRLDLAVLVLGNLAFFGLTQLGEGLPILSGALWLGLAAGTLGSLLAAVLVYAFGRSIVVAAIQALAHASRRPPPAVLRVRPAFRTPRAAAVAFSLFVPNRPPPVGPSSDSSLHQKGTPCFHFLAQRCTRLRCSSVSHSF
jgi:hypothetical protein